MSSTVNKLFKFDVPPTSTGDRLDVFIGATGISITRSQAKILISEGHVSVNDRTVTRVSTPLAAGDVVEVRIPEIKSLDLRPVDLDLKIIFEDDDLAVIDKPAGLSVHPSDTESAPTVVHGLLHALKSLSSIGGVARPGIVHRIDKGTSGLLVISKTDAAHAGLSAQFKAHSIERKYLALAWGDLSKKGAAGTIDTFYGRHPVHRKKMTGTLTAGRRAVTHWRVLEALGPLTLVECRLETGRTHQIRAHLCELGFALVGDTLYGSHERRVGGLKPAQRELMLVLKSIGHQMLHAAVLGFEHPVTKEKMRFESEPPADFNGALDVARRYL